MEDEAINVKDNDTAIKVNLNDNINKQLKIITTDSLIDGHLLITILCD